MGLGFYQRIKQALRFWLLRRLPTCRQLAPIMSESLERSLTLRECLTLWLHLWVCRWCKWYLQQLHVMSDAIEMRAAKIVEDESPTAPALSMEARERIKRALKPVDE
ncbi:MAG TPA: hypothetical protein VGC64_03385 [Pyrinomonadaceae bacterium]|jgi:hypothetical protein